MTEFHGMSITNILESHREIYICFLSLIKYYAYIFFFMFLARFPSHWLGAVYAFFFILI